MKRLVLLGFAIMLLWACEEKPKKLNVTLTEDLAKTRECHGRCDMKRDAAKARAATCMTTHCENLYVKLREQCRDPECSCSASRDSCLNAAFLRLESCQDSCTIRLEAAVSDYDKCMEECQAGGDLKQEPLLK